MKQYYADMKRRDQDARHYHNFQDQNKDSSIRTISSPKTETKQIMKKPMPVYDHKLRIIPLGGVGEVGGKNMMIYEYGRDIIVIDCGLMFPENNMLGVDFVVCDTKYLEDRKERIRGMIFTHGHEDHIGGVPFIWQKLGCPIYTLPLTAGLIQGKLDELGIKGARINICKTGEKIKLGVFTVEFVHMTHSIPDAAALAINTPEGLIMHCTDWKFDHTPPRGKPSDFKRLAELSDQGVKLLLSESTNALVPGYTVSERVVGEKFMQVFNTATGRIVIASFGSQINRIQQVIDATVKNKRKLAISGRSMENNVNIAMKLGYLSIPEGLLVDIRKINNLPDNEIVVMCTGSQGEEYSALVRMATGEHRHIKIKNGDTVVLSANPIPGNEGSVGSVIDNLYREGATVIAGKELDVHVSGHPAQEELKTLIGILQPEYFVPIHGDFRMLVEHAKMAEAVGIEPAKVFVIENGGVIEFEGGDGAIANEKVEADQVLVDGSGIGDVGNIVLRERQALAQDGMFVVILTVDQAGKIVTSPDIISRGFIYMREREDIMHGARQEVRRIFMRHNDNFPQNLESVKRMIKDGVSDYLFKETQRQPMVLPVIIQI